MGDIKIGLRIEHGDDEIAASVNNEEVYYEMRASDDPATNDRFKLFNQTY